MNEQSKILFGAVIGAVVGATAGYLFLTERGRMLRRELEPAIDDARSELRRFQGTIQKAAAVVSDGVRLVQEFTSQRPDSSSTPPGFDRVQ